jgi:hypothetical protein
MSATLLAASPRTISSAVTSRRSRITGRILSGIAVAFLLVDVSFKFIVTQAAVDGNAQLGWQMHHMPVIGAIQLACLALYLIPRTAPLGAVLWTGYLGGAIATHLRVDNPLFSHILFPIYVAAFIWGGLYLRDARVRNAVGPAR